MVSPPHRPCPAGAPPRRRPPDGTAHTATGPSIEVPVEVSGRQVRLAQNVATAASAYPLRSITTRAASRRMRSSSADSKTRGRPARPSSWSGCALVPRRRPSGPSAPWATAGPAHLVEPDLHLCDLHRLGAVARRLARVPGQRAQRVVEMGATVSILQSGQHFGAHGRSSVPAIHCAFGAAPGHSAWAAHAGTAVTERDARRPSAWPSSWYSCTTTSRPSGSQASVAETWRRCRGCPRRPTRQCGGRPHAGTDGSPSSSSRGSVGSARGRCTPRSGLKTMDRRPARHSIRLEP